jgi:protein gp37
LAFPKGFDIVMKPHKLMEPLVQKNPQLIFVNSMSDLFLDEIPDEYRDRILDTIRQAYWHTFQTLTKRPERAAEYFRARKVPANLWLGVTCGIKSALHRIDTLRSIAATVRFISVEPLLEDLGPMNLEGIHWGIVGGESGSHLCIPGVCQERGLVRRHDGKWVPREDRKPWVRSVRDQCAAKRVPFLFKQWGGSKGPIAGRTLDGRVHDEYPVAYSRPVQSLLTV